MLDEFDNETALARLLLPETPVLLDTTLEQLLYEEYSTRTDAAGVAPVTGVEH
jgi:hypothetical protein